MSLDDIMQMPVCECASRNAHLYLWVPNALLPEGINVMKTWGFRYVTNIIWAKRRKDGGPDGRGVGFYFRNVTEILLFGVKGSMRTLAPGRSQVNMIETRKREHSRKPDEQYQLIMSCSPGPYLELFARYPQPGWVAWGNEADADITPQGKTYAGYAGGPIDQNVLPPVASHSRLSESAMLEIGVALRNRYEKGVSINEIAAESGYSIARVRSLLSTAGTAFRKRGRPSTKMDSLFPEEELS